MSTFNQAGHRMNRRRFLSLSALAGGALAAPSLLSACASNNAGGSDGPRIAFSHPASQAGVVAAVASHARQRMAEVGGTFTVGALPSATPEAQFNQIEGWISQKYDAIEVFAMDAAGLAPLQQRAQDAGIKWISYMAEMEGADGTVGAVPSEHGQVLADGFSAWVRSTGLGTKALVLGYSPIPAVAPRVQIAVDTLKRETEIEIVSTQDSVDPASAQQITENTLRAHPDLDIVLSMTDDAAVGALTAFKNAGKDPDACFIGGCDGTKEALEALLANTAYKASSANDVRRFGYDLVDGAVALVNGEAMPPRTPSLLLTPADTEEINEYMTRFDDL